MANDELCSTVSPKSDFIPSGDPSTDDYVPGINPGNASQDDHDESGDELNALNTLEKEAKEYDKDAEIDRIMKAFRLDAYAVLGLQPGIPESDTKKKYRELSLLIHPDKTNNPLAPDAFDRLKKAQTTLLDEKARARLDECIADARGILIRENKYTLDSPELKTESFQEKWRKKTVEVLVDAEARRLKQMNAELRDKGRVEREKDEKMQQLKRKRAHEELWEDTREERIDSWRDWQKGAKKENKGGKKKRIKVLG